jgi:hypothetical protein
MTLKLEHKQANNTEFRGKPKRKQANIHVPREIMEAPDADNAREIPSDATENPAYEDFDEDGLSAEELSQGEGENENFRDSFLAPLPCLSPVKWIWVPQPEGKSRLIWSTTELTPRLDATEIFFIFLGKVLNAIYEAENSLYHWVRDEEGYEPPSPLDLEGFFVTKWLSPLVKIQHHGEGGVEEKKQISWKRHLSSFVIAVPKGGECYFMQPDQLIAKRGKGGTYMPEPLCLRWMRFECERPFRVRKKDGAPLGKNDFKDSARKKDIDGWFAGRMEDYVDSLNAKLEPFLGTEIFRYYGENTLRDVLRRVSSCLFPDTRPKKRGR